FEVAFAVGGRRRSLEHEAALRSDGHDDGVLDHLRLDQSQNLGAEVFGAIRPAQASARNPPPAQMHSLEARRIDEDFGHRLRFGQPRYLRRIELEGEERSPPTRSVNAPEVRARRGADQGEVLPQHAVFVQILHLIEQGFDIFDHLGLGVRVVLEGRIEAQLEQFDELARDAGVVGERGFDESERKRESDLPQIFRVSAEDDDLSRGQARGDHQTVEFVPLDLASEKAPKGVLEDRLQLIYLRVDVGALTNQPVIVNPDRLGAFKFQVIGALVQDLQAHGFEHRQAVGEHHGLALMHELEAQRAWRGFERAIERERERLAGQDELDALAVRHGAARREVFAIGGGERRPEAMEKFVAAGLAERFDQGLLQIVLPAARRDDQTSFDVGHVVVRYIAGPGAHGDQGADQQRFREKDVEIGAGPVERLFEDRLPPRLQLGGVNF